MSEQVTRSYVIISRDHQGHWRVEKVIDDDDPEMAVGYAKTLMEADRVTRVMMFIINEKTGEAEFHTHYQW